MPPSAPLPFEPDPEALRRYGELVWSWHQVMPYGKGESPTCTCRTFAVICPYVRLARDVLHMPVPWDRRQPPPPYRSA